MTEYEKLQGSERRRNTFRREVAGRLIALGSQLMSQDDAEAMSHYDRDAALRTLDRARDTLASLPMSPYAYPNAEERARSEEALAAAGAATIAPDQP